MVGLNQDLVWKASSSLGPVPLPDLENTLRSRPWPPQPIHDQNNPGTPYPSSRQHTCIYTHTTSLPLSSSILFYFNHSTVSASDGHSTTTTPAPPPGTFSVGPTSSATLYSLDRRHRRHSTPTSALGLSTQILAPDKAPLRPSTSGIPFANGPPGTSATTCLSTRPSKTRQHVRVDRSRVLLRPPPHHRGDVVLQVHQDTAAVPAARREPGIQAT